MRVCGICERRLRKTPVPMHLFCDEKKFLESYGTDFTVAWPGAINERYEIIIIALNARIETPQACVSLTKRASHMCEAYVQRDEQ